MFSFQIGYLPAPADGDRIAGVGRNSPCFVTGSAVLIVNRTHKDGARSNHDGLNSFERPLCTLKKRELEFLQGTGISVGEPECFGKNDYRAAYASERRLHYGSKRAKIPRDFFCLICTSPFQKAAFRALAERKRICTAAVLKKMAFLNLRGCASVHNQGPHANFSLPNNFTA
jgi:hypothetical protein